MIRKSTNDLTIRPKVSGTIKLLSIVGGLVLLVAALYFSYTTGIESGHARFEQDQVLVEQLNQSIVELRADLNTSQEGLTFAQRQQQIQEEAYKQISQAYANSEQKNRVLGSRVDFYRSIISPEDGQTGPAIQSLESVYAEGRLSFDIILVQAIKHKHQVRGNLKVLLYENEVATGQWPLSSPRSVNYQYFEQVSGSIETAKLAKNAKLKVEISLQGGSSLVRWFTVEQPTERTPSS